jgi:flagellar biosynthetic protein FlhB
LADKPDKESKTEEATPQKIRDAIEKGNTPFSREVASFTSTVVVGCLILFVAQDVGSGLAAILSTFHERPAEFRLVTAADFSKLATRLLIEVAATVWFILAALGLAGILAGGVQNTPRLVLHRIKPQWSRLSPMQGLSRIFGTKGQFELFKSVVKLTIVLAVGFATLAHYKVLTLNALATDPRALPQMLIHQVGILALIVAGCFGFLAVVDLLWTRRMWHVDLRMTKQEVKDEHKQSEGDPLIRAKLRSLAASRARNRMMSAVPQATVVITNPTHYAVALKYDRAQDAAPIVVAIGADLIALRIREIAMENNISIVENKPLAQALFKAAKVDQIIPAEFFQPVAEIIVYVMNRKKTAVVVPSA